MSTMRSKLVGRFQRGTILLLVVLTVSFGMLVSLAFLVSSSTSLNVSNVVDDSTRARQIAESGMAMAIAYAERTGSWRSQASSTILAQDMPLFGGNVTVSGLLATNSSASATVNDFSFELTATELSNPVLNPPMSGTIGGWSALRTAAVVTGLTVPRIGERISSSSTLGTRQAFISFGASVVGTGVLRQTLAGILTPNTEYTIKVDIGATGVPLLNNHYGFKLYAGSTVVVSSRESLVLTPSILVSQIQSLATALLSEAQTISTLVTTPNGTSNEYKLVFQTGPSPPTGAVRLELFAESVGLLVTITFDNVRITSRAFESVEFTSFGKHGSAAHTVKALVKPDIAGNGRIVRWTEP